MTYDKVSLFGKVVLSFSLCLLMPSWADSQNKNKNKKLVFIIFIYFMALCYCFCYYYYYYYFLSYIACTGFCAFVLMQIELLCKCFFFLMKQTHTHIEEREKCSNTKTHYNSIQKLG